MAQRIVAAKFVRGAMAIDLFDRVTVIDVDTHITEPPNVFVDRVPRRYRDDAPHIERHAPEGGVFARRGGIVRVHHASIIGRGWVR